MLLLFQQPTVNLSEPESVRLLQVIIDELGRPAVYLVLALALVWVTTRLLSLPVMAALLSRKRKTGEHEAVTNNGQKATLIDLLAEIQVSNRDCTEALEAAQTVIAQQARLIEMYQKVNEHTGELPALE